MPPARNVIVLTGVFQYSNTLMLHWKGIVLLTMVKKPAQLFFSCWKRGGKHLASLDVHHPWPGTMHGIACCKAVPKLPARSTF